MTDRSSQVSFFNFDNLLEQRKDRFGNLISQQTSYKISFRDKVQKGAKLHQTHLVASYKAYNRMEDDSDQFGNGLAEGGDANLTCRCTVF